jgi:hypothetical protein
MLLDGILSPGQDPSRCASSVALCGEHTFKNAIVATKTSKQASPIVVTPKRWHNAIKMSKKDWKEHKKECQLFKQERVEQRPNTWKKESRSDWRKANRT